MDKRVYAALFLLLLIGFSLRLTPFLADSKVGPDPYFHLRMTELFVQEEGLPKLDAFSQQGRVYSYAPLFHTFFASFHLASGLEIGFLISLLPAIYGSLGVLLAFVIARKLFGVKEGLFAALALALMGLHLLRTASYARPDGLSLLIIPAVIYLVYTKRFKLAGTLAVAQVLLHPLSTLFLLSFLVTWSLLAKAKKLEFHYKAVYSIVVLTTLVFLLWLYMVPLPWTQYVSEVSLEAGEMGQLSLVGFLGFFLFSWLFVLMALFKMPKNFFVKAWFGFALFFGVFATRLSIHLTMPAALLAGFGLNFLEEKTADRSKIFYALIVLLALIPIFSFVTEQEQFVGLQERAGMLWLEGHTPETASIFSQWDRGHPLAFFARRMVVVDGYFEFAGNLEERIQAMKEIISSSDCGKLGERMAQFHSEYFFVPAGAESSLSYKTGLLEAGHCENINSVYDNGSVRVLQFN